MQEDSSKVLDTSYIGLKNEDSMADISPDKNDRKEVRKKHRARLPKLNTQENEDQVLNGPPIPLHTEMSNKLVSDLTSGSPTKLRRNKKIPPGYQLANYDETMKHWNSMTYTKIVTTQTGEIEHQEYSICDNLEDLKEYGLGLYLYLEFMKRLLVICIVISVLMILPIYINYQGTALNDYQDSFALTQAKFTVGNHEGAGRRIYLALSVCDVLSMLFLFGFYLHWRGFHNQLIEDMDKDHSVLNPALYAVSVSGFDKKTELLEQNLKAYIDGLFRGAYQVEVVHNYRRNFSKFVALEEQLEKVEKERQVLKQTDKSNDDLIEYEKELEAVEQEVAEVSQQFEPIFAIIHFRNLKAKYSFINMCKRYALVNRFSYQLRRCICCTPHLPDRQKFLGKDELMIESTNLARPEEYNWNNIDISGCSRAVRLILSILLILICIIITSSLIAFCTLYVSSTSSCSSFDTATTLSDAQSAEAAGDKLIMYCYCSAHYSETFTDSTIESACSNISNDILINNIIQSGASAVSAITNVILIVVVSVVAEHLLKPESKPKEFSFIFVSVFVSNYINAAILPLILNGNIEGFQSVEYLKFAKFIDFNNVTVFKDFDTDWYAVISPYYTMFFLVAAISPLIQLFVFYAKRTFVNWRIKKMCAQEDPSNPIIQKEANATITMFPFDFPTECAIITLQLFMCFMYSAILPLAMPIFTVGLLINFICKRFIIVHFTVRIPADHSINEKIINILPFIILLHALVGVWGRTADGIFSDDAWFKVSAQGMNSWFIDRAIQDIILLGAAGLILGWIIFDFTVVNCCGALKECCKDELELPVTLATIENVNYADRLRKSNILGSYKLINNPVFKHAYKAYKDLEKRLLKEKRAAGGQLEDDSSMIGSNL